MRWLILGVTILISDGGTARSQVRTASDERKLSVEFPPTRVSRPGEPSGPAEGRGRVRSSTVRNTAAPADEPPDLSKVDRRIAKEPKYTSKSPLYGLYAFGPGAATRVWAVLDRSREDREGYDVLYFDRNADGDLTGPDERLEGDGSFRIGDLKDPATGDVHTNVRISRRADGSVFLHMTWRGKEPIAGGYAEEAGPYCQFADSPAGAPILWPGAEGPLAFQRWIFDRRFPIGGEGDARVFLGHRGAGPNTFCAVTQEFLPPGVPVLVTLIYTDGAGKERRSQDELRERC
jgi:hypothetical protein